PRRHLLRIYAIRVAARGQVVAVPQGSLDPSGHAFCRYGDTSAVAVNVNCAGRSNRHGRSNRTGALHRPTNGSNCYLTAIRGDTVKTTARWSGLDSFGRGDTMRSWSVIFEVDRRLQVDDE